MNMKGTTKVYVLVVLGIVLTISLVLGMSVVESQEGGEPNIKCDRGKIWYTGSTKNVINNDCTITTTLHSGPIAYLNEITGKYELINSTIVNSTDPKYDYEMTKGIYKAYFEGNINTGEAVKFDKDNNTFIYDLSGGKMQWSEQEGDPGKTKSIGSIQSSPINLSNNRAYYNDSFLNTNIQYEIRNEMLKEFFILKELPNPEPLYLYLEYTGEVKFPDDLSVWVNNTNYDGQDFETNSRVEFRDGSNKTIFFLPAPIATDSNGSVISLKYDFKVSADKMAFGLNTPISWLNDTNRTYPVVIDPTITLQDADTENLEDTHVQQNAADNNYGSNTAMGISSYLATANYRSFILWNLSVIPDDVIIQNSILTLHLNSLTGTNFPVVVYNTTNTTWREEWLTWNNQISEESLQGSNFTGSTNEIRIGWNVTNATKSRYLNTTSQNMSLIIKAQTEQNSSMYRAWFYTKEYSVDTTKRPRLVVTYTLKNPAFTSQTNITTPSSPNHHDLFWASVNVTSPSGYSIHSVNFTLVSENGTTLFSNQNATDGAAAQRGSQNHFQWNSSNVTLYMNGTYNISVMATDENGYENWTYWLKEVTYNQPYISNNHTHPNINQYHARVNISVNITDPDTGDYIKRIYLNVTAPNGTVVISMLNMSKNNDNWTSWKTIWIRNGTWNISVKAVDNHDNNNTFNWSLNVTWGRLNVTSQDNDKDWEFSMIPGDSEVFNVTASHTGSLNNTVNVTVSSNITDYFNVSIGSPSEVEPSNNVTQIQINITANNTVVAGTYIGYLNWNRTNNDTVWNNDSILLNITVAVQAADIDIVESGWSISKYDNEENTIIFNLWNRGNYNATNCDMDLSTSLGAGYSFNQTAFGITNTTNTTISMTVSGGTEGIDATALVSIECTATAGGSKDSDGVVGTLTIVSPTGGGTGGEGGGGGGPTCGDGTCETRENKFNCPRDCGELDFTLDGDSITFPASKGANLVCGGYDEGCPVVVTNNENETLMISVEIAKLDDESDEWAFVFDDEGNKVTTTTYLIPSKQSITVVYGVAVPGGVDDDRYNFVINFYAGSKVLTYTVTLDIGAFSALLPLMNVFLGSTDFGEPIGEIPNFWLWGLAIIGGLVVIGLVRGRVVKRRRKKLKYF